LVLSIDYLLADLLSGFFLALSGHCLLLVSGNGSAS